MLIYNLTTLQLDILTNYSYHTVMTQMTVGELKAQFSEVLEKVKQGETVQILYGRNKKPVAQIVNMAKPKKKRRILGTYAHLGPFTEVGDGKITLEEFLGVDSLDEVKPLI